MPAQDQQLCRREQLVWNDYCSVVVLFLDKSKGRVVVNAANNNR